MHRAAVSLACEDSDLTWDGIPEAEAKAPHFRTTAVLKQNRVDQPSARETKQPTPADFRLAQRLFASFCVARSRTRTR